MIIETVENLQNNFLPAYNSLLELLQTHRKKEKLTTEENDTLFKAWQSTFRSSLTLLQTYMKFMGLYPADTLAVVRSAYYNEIIKDGQDWINLHYYLSTKETRNVKLISEKYLELFEQIRVYIESEIEVYNV